MIKAVRRSKGTWCLSLGVSGFNGPRLLHCSVPDLECGILTKNSCEAYSPRFVRGSTPRGLFDERCLWMFSAQPKGPSLCLSGIPFDLYLSRRLSPVC